MGIRKINKRQDLLKLFTLHMCHEHLHIVKMSFVDLAQRQFPLIQWIALEYGVDLHMVAGFQRPHCSIHVARTHFDEPSDNEHTIALRDVSHRILAAQMHNVLRIIVSYSRQEDLGQHQIVFVFASTDQRVAFEVACS